MYICIDFDGTIVDHQFPRVGTPVPGAIDWMKKFTELGGKLILFTVRSNVEDGFFLSHAEAYLAATGIKFHGINHNPDQKSWSTSPKAYGHIYIDDSAIGCPLIKIQGFNRPCVDWDKIGPFVEKLLIKFNEENLNDVQIF